LILADVGVSGGIHSCWQAFGDSLEVWGFDPLQSEIERLQKLNASSNHTYVAARVGCVNWSPGGHQKMKITQRNDHCYMRLASSWAADILNADSLDRYDQSGSHVMTDRFVELDGFFYDECGKTPNFIKTDTDQFDIDVLNGSRRLLTDISLLGFSVESYFVGNIGPRANVFSNIDQLLRGNGFSLFDLEPIRYARRALPSLFLAPAPCQSANGQVTWAEAVYFRDLAHPDYEKMWGVEPSDVDILKLVCLFDVFNLADCAADLLVKYRDRLGTAFVDDCLDRLTPTLSGKKVHHNEFLAAFEAYVSADYDESLFRVSKPFPCGTGQEWLDMNEALRLKDEIIASLKGIVSVQDETIKRMQDTETARLRRELCAKGLLKE
jgi:hypothetical protein